MPYTIYKEFKKRRAVREFDTTANIPKETINLLLRQAWKVTPSKNNFMAYNIFVVGPEHQNYKNIAYQNCLSNEAKTDKVSLAEAQARYTEFLPFYSNILTCSYLLIFTMRLEDQPNLYHKAAMARGHRYEAFSEKTLPTIHSCVSLEVGMFSDVFGGLCMERGIDVSAVLCFRKELNYWRDLPFITRVPVLLMPIGKAKKYKGIQSINPRPNYERIVKFVE
jgi:hypothetical protein